MNMWLVGLPRLRKFGKRLHESQSPKRFRLDVTSRLIFFPSMQLRKIADIFPKKSLKNVPFANIQNCFCLDVMIDSFQVNRK